MEVLKEEMAKDEPSLILCMDSPCMLLRRAKPLEKFKIPVYAINTDNCRGCKNTFAQIKFRTWSSGHSAASASRISPTALSTSGPEIQ